MKPIDRKALLMEARAGNTDLKEARKALLRPVNEKNITIDDRDPMDRVADELSRFTMAVQEMGQSQDKDMASVLNIIRSAVDKIGELKVKMPVQEDTGPREWVIEIVSRDREGKIEKVKLTAKK